MRYFVSVVIAIFFLSACDDDNDCQQCSESLKASDFNQRYFRLITEQGQSRLYEYDTLTGEISAYNICNPEAVAAVVNGQAIGANGSEYRACNGSDPSSLSVTTYALVQCRPVFQEKVVSYSLYRQWFVFSITDADTVVYPPCETALEGGSSVEFSAGTMEGGAAENTFLGPITASTDQITIGDYTLTMSVGTTQEMFYEQKFFSVIARNSVISYSIENNVLTLENPDTGAVVVLYAN
ncbi:MAG TPA: META domain-containing protein [Chryseosolibacter sp.]|nr:META domain-containing protein [Chryseosolibacter sp.]